MLIEMLTNDNKEDEDIEDDDKEDDDVHQLITKTKKKNKKLVRVNSSYVRVKGTDLNLQSPCGIEPSSTSGLSHI